MSTYNNYFETYKQIKKHRVQLIALGVIFNRRLNINLQFLSPYSEYYSSSAPTAFDFEL